VSLLIPLYVDPAEGPGAWHRLITSASCTYTVVINPSNGPGPGPDPAFTAAAGALRAAGARLLGHVDTVTVRLPRPRSRRTSYGTGSGTGPTAASWTG
jgi:hypothetical protein